MIDVPVRTSLGEILKSICNRLELGDTLEPHWRGPRFNAGSAPIATDQSDWDIDLVAEVASKEITDRREPTDRFR